jgi:hypothetical protein
MRSSDVMQIANPQVVGSLLHSAFSSLEQVTAQRSGKHATERQDSVLRRSQQAAYRPRLLEDYGCAESGPRTANCPESGCRHHDDVARPRNS